MSVINFSLLRKTNTLVVLVIFTVLLSTLSTYATAKTMNSGILITAKTVKQLLKTKPASFVIVDLREPNKYKKSHIPSAINIPISQFHRKIDDIENFVITPLNFQRLASKHGIENHHQLIFYTDEELFNSTRAFWIFDFYGHQQISVLNGGFQKWQQHNYLIENKVNTLPPSNYKVSPMSKQLATKLNTKLAVLSKNKQIIDVRKKQEYLGKESKGKRFGHIPYADNLPWIKLVTKADQPYTLIAHSKLNDAIENIYSKQSSVIIYCNGGTESSLLYFALKLVGIESSLYDGSWHEWSADKTLPIVNPSSIVFSRKSE